MLDLLSHCSEDKYFENQYTFIIHDLPDAVPSIAFILTLIS